MFLLALTLSVLALTVGDGEVAAGAPDAIRPRHCLSDNWNLGAGRIGPLDINKGRIYRNDRLRIEVWVPDGWCINARDAFEWQVNYVTISHPDRPDAQLHLGPYAPRRDASFSSWRKWSERHLRKAVPREVATISGWPALWLAPKVTGRGHHRSEEVQGILGLGVRAPDDAGYAYFVVLSWELPFEGLKEFQNTVQKMLTKMKLSAPPK